ncbi:rCG57623 [Rattus norvegicus]|uniref:RCG57623 n=1 Tax=Rattus norvegicus TaxID=10116 RepID=A6JHG8_RAT|nr:rCG57623 [Rattus norvegicus]
MPRRSAASIGRERVRTGDIRLRTRQGVQWPLLAKSLPVTERRGREEAGGTGVLEGSPGPSAALKSLSPWPIRVPRIGVVLSGIRVPKQPARPSWRAGRRPWEPPACQKLSYDGSSGPLSSCLLSSTPLLP